MGTSSSALFGPPERVVNHEYRQEAPFALQVELTEGCNLRCSFCGLNGIRGKDNDLKFMSIETAGAVCERVDEAGWNPRIEFAMHGEPSLNPDLVPILMTFREALPHHHLMMTTNGGGFPKDPTLIDDVMEYLDVLAMDWYENVRIVPKLLEAYKGPLTPLYYPQDPAGNPHRRRPRGEKLWTVIQDIKVAEKGTHSTLNNHCGAGAPRNELGQGKRCAKPFREMSIRWDGTVAVCCNDWRGEMPCGNVLHQSFDEVWNGPVMRAVRRYLYHGRRDLGPCAGCDATSYRVGLLPDKMGKVALPQPTPEDEATVRAALGQGPLTLPVLRPWELGDAR